MTVGIVGLGLISGSMAKAYAEAHHRVLADNRNKTIPDEGRQIKAEVDGR